MVSSNFYKIAFWVLLATVLVFQIIISAVAFRAHGDTPELLLRNGQLPRTTKSLPAEAHGAQGQHGSVNAQTKPSGPKGKVWQEILSSSPRIVLLHNFATREE